VQPVQTVLERRDDWSMRPSRRVLHNTAKSRTPAPKSIDYAEKLVNESLRYYPPSYGYQYRPWRLTQSASRLLKLLMLVDAGFEDEAFGMPRKLWDQSSDARYIANKEHTRKR